MTIDRIGCTKMSWNVKAGLRSSYSLLGFCSSHDLTTHTFRVELTSNRPRLATTVDGDLSRLSSLKKRSL